MPHIIWFRNLDTAFDRIKWNSSAHYWFQKISFFDEIHFLLEYGMFQRHIKMDDPLNEIKSKEDGQFKELLP